MTRFARVVAVGVPHHVTQRGNARQYILTSDADCQVYIDLLGQNLDLHSLSLLGYCLMSNHVHLILVPGKADALAYALSLCVRRDRYFYETAFGKYQFRLTNNL